MRSEEGDWRRQDATEVWYFAEKSSHCLKVDGVTPRRKITSGAASINSLLPHAHSRNHPYPRSEGNSSSIILVPTLPPTSLRLSFFLTRLSTLPPSGSSVLPSLLGISLELNLFLRHSICHAILMNDEFMGLRETKRNSFAFLKKNVYTHTHIDASVIVGDCHNRRSRHFVDTILFAKEFTQFPTSQVPCSSTRPRVRPMNRGSANPINQNILKLGSLLGPDAAYPSFLRLHPFNKFSRRERKERFKEFSRERSRLREGGLREPRFRVRAAGLWGCRNYLILKDIGLPLAPTTPVFPGLFSLHHKRTAGNSNSRRTSPRDRRQAAGGPLFGIIIFLLARICTINAINDLGTLVFVHKLDEHFTCNYICARKVATRNSPDIKKFFRKYVMHIFSLFEFYPVWLRVLND